MISLYVSIGRQRTKRFEIAKDRVTVGSDASNDIVLRDGDVEPFHGALVRVSDRWLWRPTPATAPLAGPERPVAAGARVQAGAYTVVVAAVADAQATRAPAGTPAEALAVVDPIEERLIDAIAGGDQDSRLVYADLLEQRGDAPRAEFLRLQRALADMEPTDPAQRDPLKARLARLRELAPQLDLAWRQAVGRPVVEGCDKLRTDFACKMDWGSLAPTADPEVRRCHGCGDDVYYVTSIRDARELVRRGRCVVVDFGEERQPRDLDAPLVLPMSPMAVLPFPPR